VFTLAPDRNKVVASPGRETYDTTVQPETLSGYVIEAVQGEGGFGVVYRGRSPSGAPVAIKRARERGADPEELAQEFRLLARLRHEHIVALLDFGFEDGAPYLVTEWIEGTDLRTWARGKPLDAVAPALGGVLRALEYLHARGVLHRDLKPQNVLVDGAGRARLIDFGLAGVAGGGASRSGTPAYAAPERLLGRPEDGRSDLYSFGVILHEIVHGEPPPAGRPPRGRGSAIDALIARLLALNPAERPATANEAIAALSRASGVALAEERGAADAPPGAPVPGIVGRERELEGFRRLLRAPWHRLLLLSGEAGTGKSHLLRAFAAEALAARGRAIEARSLADLATAGGEGSGDAGDRIFAEAALRRTVVLLDDLHALLPTEVAAVERLATRLEAHEAPRPGRGLVLCVAYRPAEARDRGLGEVLERLAGLARARRLAVGPLPRAAAAAFVAEVLGRAALPEDLLDELHARAGGRAADMAELIRALVRAGAIAWEGGAWRRSRRALAWPPSAAEALRARVAGLDPAARDVLFWLRAAGPARPALLRRLTGREGNGEREALDALVAGGLALRFQRPGEGLVYGLAGQAIEAALGDDPDEARRHDALARERRDEPERAIEHAARGSDPDAARGALAAAAARLEREPLRARALLAELVRGPALSGVDRMRAVISLAEAELRLDLRETARARLDALGEPPPSLAAALLHARARLRSFDARF
jgi:hypothetical protein